MSKKNIAVIFGGCSSEYSVSLSSAASVIEHMDKERYNPVMVGISREGKWFRFNGSAKKIAGDVWCNPFDCTPATLSPDRGENGLLVFHSNYIEKIHIDAAFPVLHGKNGEDGTVQGLIELAGIPLVGCGTLSSALCMDKARAHNLALLAGVWIPEGFVLKRNTYLTGDLARTKKLGFPLFVKPVKAGSSYGITRVEAASGLKSAVELAFEHDDEVIIEESIDGFEVGCAVLGNDKLTLGEVDEIELSENFFDFTEKYTLKSSAIHVPARISREKSEEIKQTAKLIYKALNCRGFARVDLFLTPYGKIVFNEVNTIPGFTPHSRFPNMMKAAGISFEEVISRVIELAVANTVPPLNPRHLCS